MISGETYIALEYTQQANGTFGQILKCCEERIPEEVLRCSRPAVRLRPTTSKRRAVRLNGLMYRRSRARCEGAFHGKSLRRGPRDSITIGADVRPPAFADTASNHRLTKRRIRVSLCSVLRALLGAVCEGIQIVQIVTSHWYVKSRTYVPYDPSKL